MPSYGLLGLWRSLTDRVIEDNLFFCLMLSLLRTPHTQHSNTKSANKTKQNKKTF